MNSELKHITKGVAWGVFIIIVVALSYYIIIYGKTINITQQKINISYDDLMQTKEVATGRMLYEEKCRGCHPPINHNHEMLFDKIADNDYDRKELYAFIRNSDSVVRSGNAYYNALVREFNNTKMKSFPELTDEDIDMIISYIKVEKTFQRLKTQ